MLRYVWCICMCMIYQLSSCILGSRINTPVGDFFTAQAVNKGKHTHTYIHLIHTYIRTYIHIHVIYTYACNLYYIHIHIHMRICTGVWCSLRIFFTIFTALSGVFLNAHPFLRICVSLSLSLSLSLCSSLPPPPLCFSLSLSLSLCLLFYWTHSSYIIHVHIVNRKKRTQ